MLVMPRMQLKHDFMERRDSKPELDSRWRGWDSSLSKVRIPYIDETLTTNLAESRLCTQINALVPRIVLYWLVFDLCHSIDTRNFLNIQ